MEGNTNIFCGVVDQTTNITKFSPDLLVHHKSTFERASGPTITPLPALLMIYS